jgi:hypothetical protein
MDDVLSGELEERKKKLINYLKSGYSWIVYLFLALIIFITVKIRMLPLKVNSSTGQPGLWDITTNTWTLGPDLDPFLFLRWMKEIVAQGSLAAVDNLRYIPLGFNTKEELLLHPYLMVWFHKLINSFGSFSVEYSAIVFPVFMFALTVIAFFFLVRKIFITNTSKINANLIALVSSLFISIIPSILPRTIAGIPEKESSGFFFLFLAFYFFISSWRAKSISIELTFAALAGVATAAMAGVWGGFIYVLLTIALTTIIAFFFNQIDKRKIYVYSVWIISSYILMSLMSARYSFGNLIGSTTTLIPLAVLAVLVIHEIIFTTKLKHYTENNWLAKIPPHVVSLIVTFVLGIVLASIIFKPSFIFDKFSDLTQPLIQPITDRLGVTVAENSRPDFKGWADTFGPLIKGIPIFFWLFLIGSIYLYYNMMHVLSRKERIIVTLGYAVFLFTLIFSDYSSSSILNGSSLASILFYIIGLLALVSSLGYHYYHYHKKAEKDKFKTIDFGLIFIFSFFFFSLVSARGAVRLIMLLVPSSSILVSYLVVGLWDKVKATASEKKIIPIITAIIITLLLLFSAYRFYSDSKGTAEYYIPSAYTQQWQKAMSWVRENTSQDAVFGHWWDYGYWVQTMGQRATVLDGGNAISFWDHLMGRYGLTSPDNQQALDFLYAHNTTHFLIDSSDIGKYSAFSSIGADENYDRMSYIPTFVRDTQQTQENKNSTKMLLSGQFVLDEDIIYSINGTKVILPAGRSYLGAVIIEKNTSNSFVSAPIGIFVFQGKQYQIPFRYAFDSKFTDFGSGIEYGLFVFPMIQQSSSGIVIDKNGASLILSSRTVKSQLARLYLYNEDNTNFKLIHDEDDSIVAQLKLNGALSENQKFVYYQGLRGPISIWQISYPSNMILNESYLSTYYPDNIHYSKT